MADEADNLILEYMRRFDIQLKVFDSKLDRLGEDMHELKVRMTHVDENLAGVHRSLDRMDFRMERIEKRLELIDSPYGGVRE